MSSSARVVRTGLLLLVALVLGSCGVLPRDSAGTLDRARGGKLRVGVAHHPPWVRADDGTIGGIEPELIESWARQLGASVIWRRGAEADLVEALYRRELDVLATGFQSGTPYGPRIALTRPYVEVEDRYGSRKQHVLAVMPGESALLLSLDRFLASQDKAALERRAQQWQREAGRP